MQFLKDNKDALGILFGSGVVLAVLGGIYKFIVWVIKEYRLRRIRTNDNFPFKIIPPNSNIAKEILGGADDNPLADRNIPYQQRIQGRNTRRELEELIEDFRWLLITGRTGLGKTREAVQLAQSLNNEGWTVLYLTREGWLDAPAKLPANVPERKLVFFLDDLNKKCLSSKAEVRPNANESLTLPIYEPFQTRLQRTLEAFDTFCGKSEVKVIATARNEIASEFDEPSEWDKLGWTKHKDLWEKFRVLDLPEPDDIAEQKLLSETAKKANISIKLDELTILTKRNDGTFRNLVENLLSSQTEGFNLTAENFRDTLKGTWKRRYEKAVQRNLEAKYIYDAIEILREINITLRPSYVRQVAELLFVGNIFDKLKLKWKLFFILKQLISTENLLSPRDDQIEAKGYRIYQEKYLPILYKQFYSDWERKNHILLRVISIDEKLKLSFVPKSIFVPEKGLSYSEKLICFVLNLYATIQNAGESYESADFPFIAESIYRKALELKNANILFRVFHRHSLAISWADLGDVYHTLKRYEESINAYQQAIKFSSKHRYSWYKLGGVYQDLQRYEDAINSYKKAINISPKYRNAWNKLGELYRELERHDDAIQSYKKVIELDPKHSRGWDSLGNVYQDQARHEDAIRAYRKAIELDPRDEIPWIYLGILYFYDLEKEEDAIEVFQKAIAINPKHPYPWFGLGNIYTNQDLDDKAEAAYRKATELDSEFARPWYGLGNLYQKKKLYDNAVNAYKKAIELQPGATSAWNGLGSTYRNLGQYNEAIHAYEKVIEIHPNDESPWYYLGIIYSMQKQNEKALLAYQKASELKQNNGLLYSSICGTLKKLGRNQEASELEKTARKLIEEEEEYNRACFEAICGNTEEALVLLKIALEKKQVDLTWVKQDPDFDFIRDNPQFKEFVELS